MQPIRVRILGNEYLLKTEEDEEQALRIAEYVNEKLTEVQDNQEGLSDKKTAILVALNIASDYFQLLKERDKMLSNIRRRTESLICNIDATIG